MNDKKQYYYIFNIISCLLKHEVLTTKMLAEELRVSEKTIRNQMIKVEHFLAEYELGKICKKPRIGHWLDASFEQTTQLKELLRENPGIVFVNEEEERVFATLKYILLNPTYHVMTTNQLADLLYLSIPTTHKTLKSCEQYLSQYHVKLKYSRNHGIQLVATEINYRNLMKKIIMRNTKNTEIESNLTSMIKGIQLNEVKKVIVNVENEWNFEFSDESFYEILTYCCIAIARSRNHGIIHIEDDIAILESYPEYNFAMAIFDQLEEKFNCLFSLHERRFMAIQILCSRFIDEEHFNSNDVIRKCDLKLYEFTQELIVMVSSILSINLTGDKILMRSLINHLRSTIFRLENGKNTNNTMIYYIKKQYQNLFRQLWGTSILFEKYFNIKITENDLGYICLYVQASIDRIKSCFKIYVISDQPNSTNQFIANKISNRYQNTIEITFVSAHDQQDLMYGKEAIVLSLVPFENKNDHWIAVNNIFDDGYLNEIEQLMSKLCHHQEKKKYCFDPIFHKLFNPDLLLVQIQVVDKNDLIKQLSDQLLINGYVKEGFYHSVIEREKATPTEIGNGIALPHGNQKYVNEVKVAVAILKEPIIWHYESVSIVFLLAMRMNSETEKKITHSFYQQYVDLVESKENIKTLLEMKNKVELYQYLIR